MLFLEYLLEWALDKYFWKLIRDIWLRLLPFGRLVRGAISRTKRAKGRRRISNFVFFWYLRISIRALVPARNLFFFRFSGVPIDFLPIPDATGRPGLFWASGSEEFSAVWFPASLAAEAADFLAGALPLRFVWLAGVLPLGPLTEESILNNIYF